jgi:hypothetical protein
MASLETAAPRAKEEARGPEDRDREGGPVVGPSKKMAMNPNAPTKLFSVSSQKFV